MNGRLYNSLPSPEYAQRAVEDKKGRDIADILDELLLVKPIIVESASNTTISGYSVPNLTVEQVTQIYNKIVAGGYAIVTDKDNHMHALVTQADAINNEINIIYTYFDMMILTYSIVDNSVTISHKDL